MRKVLARTSMVAVALILLICVVSSSDCSSQFDPPNGSSTNPHNARVSGTYDTVRLELTAGTTSNTSTTFAGRTTFDGVGEWTGSMDNSLGNTGISNSGDYDLNLTNKVDMTYGTEGDLLGAFDQDEIFAALYDANPSQDGNPSEDLIFMLKEDDGIFGSRTISGTYYMATLRTPFLRDQAVAEFGAVEFFSLDGTADIEIVDSTAPSADPQALDAEFTLSTQSGNALTLEIARAGDDVWQGEANTDAGIAILTDLDDQDGLADDQDVDIALLVKPGDDFSLSKLFGSYTAIRMSVGTDGTNPQVMKGYLVFGLNGAVSGQLKTADQSASKDLSGTVSLVDAGPSFTLQADTGDVLLGAMNSDESVGVLSDLNGGTEEIGGEVDLIVLIKKA
ncbi:hypothetical protein ACFL1X_01835 [Candidatus Hydrogenedentota bacterium]